MRDIIAIILTSLLPFGTTIAEAHAFLDHAEPRVGSTVQTAPREISLAFTQELEPAFSSVTVTDHSGATVNDPAQIDSSNKSELDVKLKALPPGTYKVQWHVLSVDTHTIEGDYSFHVGGK